MPLFLFLIVSCENKKENTCQSNEGCVIVKKGLNLRAEPNVSSKVLALVPYRERANLLEGKKIEAVIDGITGNWVNASYNGKTGWLFDGFLSDREILKSTRESLKALAEIMDNLTSPKVRIGGNYYELGLSPEEVLKRFGKPLRLENLEDASVFVYKDCYIGFDDFFNGPEPTLENYKITSYKHDYKTEILYYLPSSMICYNDVEIFSKGNVDFHYSPLELKWGSHVEYKDFSLWFEYKGKNDYVELIIVAKKKK
jgi:hypothetical protein